ncbi:MAG: methyltransferase domain-containing protein, partial [Pseudomonadota bacterium]
QSRELNLDIAFRQGCAEATELSDACAEVVVAGQCWHWFDGSRAARECMRLLTPAGRLVIAHFDWLPYPGNVVDATEQLIKQANPAWHLGEGNGFYPQWLPVLSEAGFVELESFSYDVDVAYTLDAWRGRIQASAGIASLEADARERFDRALHAYLAQRPAALLPGQALAIPHRVFAIVGRASNKP